MADLFVIGFIRSPHGVDGYMHVQSTSGEVDHFLNLKKITLRKNDVERVFEVEDASGSPTSFRIKLAGITTPEEAKTYSGWEMVVPRGMACPLNDGEWYARDLCQCNLVYEGNGTDIAEAEIGSILGIVTNVVEGGAGDLLEVALPDGATVLVPLKEMFIGKVDVAGKNIGLKHRWILEH